MRYSNQATLIFCLISALLTANRLSTAQVSTEQHTSVNNMPTPTDDQALNGAGAKGIPLNVVSNVSHEASVEAVLIPASVGERVFGKEVAHKYAVIELIVSNKDSKAGLILQSVFLDYSRWLLSGLPLSNSQPPLLEATQRANKPWQVASMESRLVRGELLDAQQWTARNWTIRSLTALGSVGAGFAFPFSGDVSRGMSAFNGVVIPAASALWPDATMSQINRVNDSGFQTNKIIPKQASDIIVAFFPIDRFLTPTFKKLFLDNPAGFFAPGELLTDPKMSKVIAPLLMPMVEGIENADNLKGADSKHIDSAKALPGIMARAFLADCQDKQKQATTNCRLQQLFTQLSLNCVHVVIGGVMSVDVAAVPATIYEVDFDEGNADVLIWNMPGEHDGKIVGVYLGGATLSVVDGSGSAIDGISLEVLPGASSDTELAFHMTVSKCIPPSTKLYFVATKPPDTSAPIGGTDQPAKSSKKTGIGIPSTPYQFVMPAYSCTAEKQKDGEDGAFADKKKSAPPPQ